MKTNLIIGAGQLGSRHLQGLLKLSDEQVIYVLDTSEESLQISRQRAVEVEHSHEVIYITDIMQLPKKINLAIIATGSNVRRIVTEKLLQTAEVEFIILEKVLFQDLESYDVIDTLVSKHNCKVWVNHPRRMYKYYQEIAGALQPESSQATFEVYGGDWGLGCNGIHFADLFTFLANSPLTEIDLKDITPELKQSKRAGYYEFTGRITGKLENGAVFSITSRPESQSHVTITAFVLNNRWIIQEGGTPAVIKISSENNYQADICVAETYFQSSLTTEVAGSLFATGTCSLPSYSHAMQTHKIYIAALLEKYRELSGVDTKFCPIT